MGKIGVVQWCLDKTGTTTLYRALELGLTAIQIDAGRSKGNPPLDNARNLEAYRSAQAATGIIITAVAVNVVNQYGLTSKEGSINAAICHEVIRLGIEAASELSVPVVIIPSFHSSLIHTQDDCLRTADQLRQACAYAASSGVCIASENQLGIQGNLALLHSVNHSSFRIFIDSYNPVMYGHKVADLLLELHPSICKQIHLKDGKNGIMGSELLAHGDADINSTFAALSAVHYTGDFLLENRYHQDTEQRLAHDIAVVKSWLSTPSQSCVMTRQGTSQSCPVCKSKL